jgi:hypothetical protein
MRPCLHTRDVTRSHRRDDLYVVRSSWSIAWLLVLTAVVGDGCRRPSVGLALRDLEPLFPTLTAEVRHEQRRTMPLFALRQLPCLAALRARRPTVHLASGTIAFRIERTSGGFKFSSAHPASGNLEDQFATCVFAAAPWTSTEFPGSAADRARRNPRTVYLLWPMTWKMRAAYPPLPEEWANPRTWEILPDGSYSVAPGWEALVAPIVHAYRRTNDPEALVCTHLEPNALPKQYPALGEALYPYVYSSDAAKRFQGTDCSSGGIPRSEDLADRGTLDILINVVDEVAHIDIVRATDLRGRLLPKDLEDCVVHKVDLPIPSVAAPGQPDVVVAVHWPVRFRGALSPEASSGR